MSQSKTVQLPEKPVWRGIDAVVGQIIEENPDLEIYLTADHGMSAKTRGVASAVFTLLRVAFDEGEDILSLSLRT